MGGGDFAADRARGVDPDRVRIVVEQRQRVGMKP